MRFTKPLLVAGAALALAASGTGLQAQSQSVSAGALGTQVLKNFQNLSASSTGHVASANAAWSTFTPAKSGVLQLDTTGTPADTTLAAYTGANLFALSEIAFNDDAAAGIKTSLVRFKVTAGSTYRIAVDHKPSSAKSVVALNRALLESESAPAAYSGQVTIPSASLTAAAADAPKPAGTACEFTWWQRFKAPRDGTLVVDTTGSTCDTVLAVYAGPESAAYKDLTPVTSNDDFGDKNTSRVTCPVKADAWLAIQIGGKGRARGNVVLNYSLEN